MVAAGLVVPGTAGQAEARRVPEVNLALSGSVAAAGGQDAGAAVDGNAATAWCPAGPSGTLANGDDLGNFLWQESQLVPGYPASPDGQRAFLSDLLSAVAAVPDGRGAGVPPVPELRRPDLI